MDKIKVKFSYDSEDTKDEWRFIHEPFFALKKKGERPYSAIIMIPKSRKNSKIINGEDIKNNKKRIGCALALGSNIPLVRRIKIEQE